MKTFIEEYIMFDRSEASMIPNYYFQIKEVNDTNDYVSKNLNVAYFRFFNIDENGNKINVSKLYYNGELVSKDDLVNRMEILINDLNKSNDLKEKLLIETKTISISKCLDAIISNPKTKIIYFNKWDDYLVMEEDSILYSSTNKEMEELLKSHINSFDMVSKVLSGVEDILKASGATYNAIPLAKEEIAKVMENNKAMADKYGLDIQS